MAHPGSELGSASPPLTLCACLLSCLQVFYNNLLSLPLIALMMAVTGKARNVWAEPDLQNKTFLLVAATSGIIGFAIR